MTKWEIENVSDALSDSKTYDVRCNKRYFCSTASIKTAEKIIAAIDQYEKYMRCK